ncbi:hypothetical protein CLF_107662 [Clonorchis sinensis]|uniref:Uncharacterized protein n=1 Tax=Clonorchis sinensis TaxID=79923 RepID=G7YQW8_CLOSI|nr:hypothetical protein CLF_107662 [Clonorchis sinensis]
MLHLAQNLRYHGTLLDGTHYLETRTILGLKPNWFQQGAFREVRRIFSHVAESGECSYLYTYEIEGDKVTTATFTVGISLENLKVMPMHAMDRYRTFRNSGSQRPNDSEKHTGNITIRLCGDMYRRNLTTKQGEIDEGIVCHSDHYTISCINRPTDRPTDSPIAIVGCVFWVLVNEGRYLTRYPFIFQLRQADNANIDEYFDVSSLDQLDRLVNFFEECRMPTIWVRYFCAETMKMHAGFPFLMVYWYPRSIRAFLIFPRVDFMSASCLAHPSRRYLYQLIRLAGTGSVCLPLQKRPRVDGFIDCEDGSFHLSLITIKIIVKTIYIQLVPGHTVCMLLHEFLRNESCRFPSERLSTMNTSWAKAYVNNRSLGIVYETTKYLNSLRPLIQSQVCRACSTLVHSSPYTSENYLRPSLNACTTPASIVSINEKPAKIDVMSYSGTGYMGMAPDVLHLSALFNIVFNERITERQSYLKDSHCDTQRRLCQTCLRRSCWRESAALNSSSDTWDQTLGDDLAQKWDLLGDASADFKRAKACPRLLCKLGLFLTLSLVGKTLKFTLNPEFDLANGSFMCHLTRVPPENLYTINAWLVVNGTWKTDPVSHVVSLRPPNGIRDSRGAHSPQSMKHLRYRRAESSLNRNLRGVVLLWNDKLRVEHQSSASLWEQLILKRKNAPGQFYVYRLKSFEEFGLAPPQYEKHREEKYATVQFTTPFLHNTESWGNESCQLNISHMHKSQPIYDETSEIPIVLASPTRRNANGAFQYTLNEAQLGTKIQVTMEVENQDSLLRSALCIQNLRLSPMYKMTAKNQTDWFRRQIGHIINRVGMELKVTSRLINTELDTDRCERMESWRVSIEGWVTEKPAYLDLLVEKQIVPPQGTDNVESSASLPILKQDILLLPGLQQQTWNRPPNLKETQHPFLLEFDLTKITKGHPVANRTYTINIYLRDCVQNYHLETNLGDDYVSSASSQETDRPLVPVFSKPPERMWKLERLYLPFIIICIVIGLLYLVLLTAYCFVRACSGTSKHSSVVAHHRATRTVPSVSMSSSTSLLSGATTELQSSEPMTAARKVLIMVYLCFRVFYTFLFTISVGLSLILSIESNSARDFTAALYSNTGYSFSHTNGRLPPRPSPYVVTPTEVESRWRESNSWMFEAARMEDFAHSELLRQADAPTEPVVGKGDVKAHDTQQMWATNPVYGNFLPLHRSTWKLLEQANWIPYLDTVDVHLQKIRDVLDTEVIDQWTPFDRLLNNLLVNNWIAPARRSMNTSWTRVGDAPTSEIGLFGISDSEYYSENIDTSPSDPMNQKRQREARALKLANFIGVPQPAHARLSGARIWNSFRSQVFGLPTYFHYDISGNLNAGEGEPQKAKFSSMRYYDRRYMLSNEDWQHVSGGFLEGGRHTIQRHIQNAQTQMRLNVATTSGAYSSSNYFLSLTQVRLLLLLLDAVIILARCCQTYRFLQRFWFGKLKRVSMDALHAEVPLPLNNINESKGSAVRTSSEGNTLQTSYISDRNPLTWSDSDGYTPHIRDSSVPILGVEHIHQGIQQPDLKNYRQLRSTVSFGRTGNRPLPGLRHRSGDVGSYMDGSQGRLTACYCCLDSHYLLIIVGIGLLILGIVLLWVTDRHVRTGWLLAR